MYKDRGIMKWAPFDALSGFTKLIGELKHNRNKVERPIFTQDVLDEFTITINEAMTTNVDVEIEYYEDGYFKKNVCKIRAVNMLLKTIILESNIILNMIDVTNIIL